MATANGGACVLFLECREASPSSPGTEWFVRSRLKGTGGWRREPTGNPMSPDIHRNPAGGSGCGSSGQRVQSLQPSSTYEAQVVASNPFGTTESNVVEFTTSAALPSPTPGGQGPGGGNAGGLLTTKEAAAAIRARLGKLLPGVKRARIQCKRSGRHQRCSVTGQRRGRTFRGTFQVVKASGDAVTVTRLS